MAVVDSRESSLAFHYECESHVALQSLHNHELNLILCKFVVILLVLVSKLSAESFEFLSVDKFAMPLSIYYGTN